jgi:hypothetical protein
MGQLQLRSWHSYLKGHFRDKVFYFVADVLPSPRKTVHLHRHLPVAPLAE